MRGVFFWEFALISTDENKRQNDMDDEKSRQDKLLSIQKLMQSGRFKAALLQLDELLDTDPMFSDALYMKAACFRYLKKIEQAFETLENLKSIMPEFGRAYQEQGHLYRLTGEKEKALKSFKAATQ